MGTYTTQWVFGAKMTSYRRRYDIIFTSCAALVQPPQNAAPHPFHTVCLYVGWLVVWGLTALLVSISVYIGPFPREREKEERNNRREKKSKQPPPAPTAGAEGPCPTITQTSRTPRHWKFITKHHRTTRPLL